MDASSLLASSTKPTRNEVCDRKWFPGKANYGILVKTVQVIVRETHMGEKNNKRVK